MTPPTSVRKTADATNTFVMTSMMGFGSFEKAPMTAFATRRTAASIGSNALPIMPRTTALFAANFFSW